MRVENAKYAIGGAGDAWEELDDEVQWRFEAGAAGDRGCRWAPLEGAIPFTAILLLSFKVDRDSWEVKKWESYTNDGKRGKKTES